MRRKALGLSQTTVAERLNLTFQQLQKYERGANRISASKLYGLATVLGVSINWFYEGLPDTIDPDAVPERELAAQKLAQGLLCLPEGAQIAEAFARIPATSKRRKLLALIKAMAEPIADQADEAA
jgi:transcriptional regulator with XRE-family HTH domain